MSVDASRPEAAAVQKHASRAAIVLVVVENALADLGVSFPTPPIEPLNGSSAGGMLVSPREPEILGQVLIE
jgi:hypothetical protein